MLFPWIAALGHGNHQVAKAKSSHSDGYHF